MIAIDLIKKFEGCRLNAYQDRGGVWTIGYGHTVGVREGMTIAQDEADAEIGPEVAKFAAAVEALTKEIPTTENQMAAMVSLTYNIGTPRFRTSSVLRFHRAQDYQKAGDAFLMWDKEHVDGELVFDQGLLNRRKAEREIYLT